MTAFDFFSLLYQRPPTLLVAKIFRVWQRGGIAGLCWRLRMLRNQTRGYRKWIRTHESIDAPDLAFITADIDAMGHTPLISVVMPVCDVPEKWLGRAIDSVRSQLYPHWELCIADDASTSPHVRTLLEAAAEGDSRIRLVFRQNRGHICLATRSALALAEGEFITFLDHDDEISPLALYRVASELNRHTDADLLYGDEDLIGTDGQRYDPYFKPEWNPELLRAQNYLCHMSVYRADLLRGVDAFRPEVQGSQDWDLSLRVAERAKCIRHIPHILYHWRSLPGSTAHSDIAKDYSLLAGRQAVADHLVRCGEKAEAKLLPFGHLQVRHSLLDPAPRVSLIVTNYSESIVGRHLEALLSQTRYPELEVLIAAASPDDNVTQRCGARVIHAKDNDTPSSLLNRVALVAKGDILCFLDGRCETPDADWLATLASQACRPEIGAAGVRLLLPDNRVWHAGYLLDPETVVKHPYRGAPSGFAGIRNRAILQQNVTAVSSACLAVRKSLFVQTGGFQAASGIYHDVDFCLRLLVAGLHNVWCPDVSLILHAQPDFDKETPDQIADVQSLRYMREHWREWLTRDPAGNPNLVLERGLPVPDTMKK